MNAQVVLSGWNPRLSKVGLSTILRERSGMSLRDAHVCVSRLIDGETVRVGVPSIDEATGLANKVIELGVRFAIS